MQDMQMLDNCQCKLERVEVEGVSGERTSAVCVAGPAGGVPVVLVHGILDNLWRWLTKEEAARHGLALPDNRPGAPLFHPDSVLRVAGASLPQPWRGTGLLERLRRQGRAAVAFSYQHSGCPVADMPAAVEKLHRVVVWTCEHYGCGQVDLVGHSRGGLVARHALLCDSAVMRAAEFRRCVRSVVAVGTPHLGSRLAEVIQPLQRAFQKVELVREKLLAFLPNGYRPVRGFLVQLLENIGQLSPESEEVLSCRSECLPPLPGGYFAVAGNDPTYVSWTLPVIGSGRLPPRLPASLAIPELSPGLGDMAVAVTSALDVPEPDEGRTAIVPLNHLNITFDGRVHELLLRWLAC